MSLEDGLTAFKRGNYTDAIALLETYCKSCEQSGAVSSRNYMQAGMALVKSYHAERQTEKAIAQCEAFMACEGNPALKIWADKTFPKLQQAPTEPEPQADSSSAAPSPPPGKIELLEAGIAAQKRGNNEQAIEALEAYLETCANTRSRNYIQAQIARIKAYRDIGNIDRAYALCEELHTSDSPALQSWVSKAMIALRPPTPVEQTRESGTTQPNSGQSDTVPSNQASHPSPKTQPRSQASLPIPIKPGVAQPIDNTSTVVISAVPGASNQPSSPSEDRSFTSPSGGRTISRSSRSSSRSQNSSPTRKASQVKGTGAAALLGGGAIALLTKLLFRRGGGAVIVVILWAIRGCFGGGSYVSNSNYSGEGQVYTDHSELHYAACIGEPEVAASLIQQGMNVDITDSDGNTPLFWAVSGCSSTDQVYPITPGHESVALLLMEGGASVTATNVYGETPLHWAAAWGNATLTTNLIAQGAYASAVDDYQSTPLHWSAWAGNQSSTEALVNVGVPLNTQNADGDTPLDLANYDPDNAAVATFLQSRGAIAINTAQ